MIAYYFMFEKHPFAPNEVEREGLARQLGFTNNVSKEEQKKSKSSTKISILLKVQIQN